MTCVVRRADQGDAQAVFNLHLASAGEFIWPRTREEFEALIYNRCVTVALVEGCVVGMCYIMASKEPASGDARWEFGGVFVVEDWRGRGLASLLGYATIGSHLLLEGSNERQRLIAHVHVGNQDPRGLLTKRLFFVQEGQETALGHEAPESMRRDESGEVVGDLFVFERANIDHYATWFEAFDGQVRGKSGRKLPVAIEMMPFSEGLPQVVAALRSM